MGRPSTTSRWRAPSAGKRSLRPTHQQRGPRSHNRERGPLMLGHPTVHRYIWVIDSTGIPYILECGQSTPAGHVPKHSNLTGGMPASMGGELWFETRCSLFPPRDEQQLADTATVLEDYGYGITYNTRNLRDRRFRAATAAECRLIVPPQSARTGYLAGYPAVARPRARKRRAGPACYCTTCDACRRRARRGYGRAVSAALSIGGVLLLPSCASSR